MRNPPSCDSKSLFMMLARLNGQMIDIWCTLNEKPAVLKASRWCDLTMLPDPMEPEEERAFFDTCVEVETQGGESLIWSMEICVTSKSWTLDRAISKVEEYGAQKIMLFEEITFERFADLAEQAPLLAEELVAYARTFDFAR